MKRRPLSRLENALEPFAVSGLGYYLVIGQAAVWLLGLFRPSFPFFLQLDFARMFGHHEWWRAFTFVLAPPLPGAPFSLSHLFMIFGWLFFCTMTIALEGVWGKLRANLFLLLCSGFIGLGAWVDYHFLIGQEGSEILALAVGFYLFESVFLTFAYRFPDYPVRLFFVLEIKVAWMAWAVWALMLLNALTSLAVVPLFLGLLLPFLIANGHDLWTRHLRHRLRPKHDLLTPDEATPGEDDAPPPLPLADGFEWYYEDDEKPLGPVSSQALLDLLNLAEISPATRIWRKGMEDWEPLLQRPEFASVLPGRKPVI